MIENKRINNCFDFLRFFFAIIVIYSHSFVLLGVKNEFFSNFFKLPLSYYAIAGFFIISGYLISASWYSDPSIKRFCIKRLLRVMPALIFIIFLSVLIVGPLLTQLPIKEYFLDKSVWIYFWHNISIIDIRYSIADLFKKNPYPFVVNGSLWSLPIELYAYLMVILFGKLNLKKIGSLLFFVLFLTSYFFLKNNPNFENMVYAYVLLSQLIKLMIFFMAGRLIYLFNFYKSKPVALLSLLMIMLFINNKFFTYQLFLTYSYLVIYFAYNCPNMFKRFREKFGDFSYGMYVYAFPIQQTIIYFLFPSLNFFSFFSLSLIITLIVSIISWYFIEEPCLSLKDKINLYLK